MTDRDESGARLQEAGSIADHYPAAAPPAGYADQPPHRFPDRGATGEPVPIGPQMSDAQVELIAAVHARRVMNEAPQIKSRLPVSIPARGSGSDASPESVRHHP
jgi:hypothetical protein